MTKLCQIIAVEKDRKSKFERTLTDLHRQVQTPPLINGIHRTYQPKDEDGDQLPPESTLVQLTVEKVLQDVAAAARDFYDVTLTKETANAHATADIVVDGQTIAAAVPVTYLLFLEKQLVNLRTFVAKLPTLDPAQNWNRDDNTGINKADPVRTVRTKKVPKNWVKAEATKEHPAQVDVFHEDVLVGTWTKVDTSGAIPATRKAELLDRVDALTSAVKFAREEANGLSVDQARIGEDLFGYLFA